MHESREQNKKHQARENQQPKNRFWSKTLFSLKLIVPALIIIAAMAGYGALKSAKPVPQKPERVEKVWPARSIIANAETIIPTLNLFGKTVSRRQVELRALVAGKIISTGPGLKEGALVKKGDVLLAIDDFDYKGALREATAYLQEAVAKKEELAATIELEKQNLKFAKTQARLADRDYKRAADLSKRGTVTKKLADDRQVILSQRTQQVATYEKNLDLQNARLEGQKAVIERLKWKVDQAERRLEETRLIAPFDAYVSTVSAEIGRTVSANDRIANLIDTEMMDVRFILSDAQYGRILASDGSLMGRQVNVVWKVGQQPLKYKATIVRIGAEIASETGGVEIYAAIETGANAAPIRAGAFVEVEVNDRKYVNVYRLPQTAIYEGDKIYTIINSRLEPHAVEIVGYASSDVLVKAAINKGSEILTSRLTLAGKGVKVKTRHNSKVLVGKKPQKAGKTTEGL